VKAIQTDRQGNIVALCNPGESWSPRRKADVIKDISQNKKSYYVAEIERRSYVHVAAGKSLRTHADEGSGNNLDRLPKA
jgi:hypothetical protein